MTIAASPIDPDFLAHRYDPQHDAIHFIPVDRAARRRSPFLTDAALGGERAPMVLRRADALTHCTPPRVHFIFHSAYCCSTLLANAYDQPGRATSFKEPVLLNDLVGWRMSGAPSDRLAAVIPDALVTLARPFEPGEICVIKPSNVVNPLAPSLIAARPEARVLLLQAPIDIYLGSIAGKGFWGRHWARDLLAKLLAQDFIDLGFSDHDYLLHTDLQVAAVGWLAQHVQFANLARQWPDRVRTLSSETLLAHPVETLTALDRLFGLPSAPSRVEEVVATHFARHAKTGERFGSAERSADQKRAAGTFAEEIQKVVTWIEAVAANAGCTMELPEPLVHPTSGSAE